MSLNSILSVHTKYYNGLSVDVSPAVLVSFCPSTVAFAAETSAVVRRDRRAAAPPRRPRGVGRPRHPVSADRTARCSIDIIVPRCFVLLPCDWAGRRRRVPFRCVLLSHERPPTPASPSDACAHFIHHVLIFYYSLLLLQFFSIYTNRLSAE